MEENKMNDRLLAKMENEQNRYLGELIDADEVRALTMSRKYHFCEDLIHALRRQPITEAQAAALLCSDTPLDDVYCQLVGMAEQRHCLLHQAIENLAESNLQRWNLPGRCKSGDDA